MTSRQIPKSEREDRQSDCCRAEMVVAGGDGTHGSTCWAECRACGEPCTPVLFDALSTYHPSSSGEGIASGAQTANAPQVTADAPSPGEEPAARREQAS